MSISLTQAEFANIRKIQIPCIKNNESTSAANPKYFSIGLWPSSGSGSDTPTPTVSGPVISVVSLPNGTSGTPYNTTLTASGTAPISWTLASGSLPDGLTLSSSGTISGTPTKSGTFTFTVQAQNADGTATKSLTIIIPSSEVRSPSITSSSLPDGFTNSPYSFNLTSTGTTPITWSLADSTALPDGLTLSTSGYITGTPTAAGTSTFKIQAQNSAGTDSKSLSLKISAAPSATKPSITTLTPAPAAKNSSYTCQLTASGTPPFTWTVRGKLPEGITMNNSGLITGTPTKKTSSKINVTATNNHGSDTKKLSLTVYEMPEITTNSLNDATVNKRYNVSLKAKGSKPLTWKYEGKLPQDIEFDEERGKIYGTPSTNDAGMILVTLSNPVGEVSKVFTLNVNAVTPTLSPAKLSAGTWGKNYRKRINAKGTQPITLYLEGNLPEGLTFDSDSGIIEGTPEEVCTDRPIRIIASNMGGIVSKDYKLTIKAVAPKITTRKLTDAKINMTYSADIIAGGTPTITFTAEGLPDGLSITSEGRISGTPTKSGTFNVKIIATNDLRSVQKNYRLKVLAAPEFTGSTELPSGTEGKSYSQKLNVSGTTPITFSLTNGSLPNGITLNVKSGQLEGKPKASGNFTFTVKASNSVGNDEETFTLNIAAKASKNNAPAPLEVWPYNNNDGTDKKAMLLEGTEGYVSLKNNNAVRDDASVSVEEYIIIAELPEFSVDVSGMYTFSATLSPDIEAGAKLLWLANSSEPSDDDKIAEFYDVNGEEIDSVPEDRKISVEVWLNKDRIYYPAIAVK